MDLLNPIFLGAIATAISESDGNWTSYVKAVLVTLVSFSITSVIVFLAFPHSLLMAILLVVASFPLTILSSLGKYYQKIAFSTLIFAVYTMMIIDRSGIEEGVFSSRIIFLLAGASWYGFFSILWKFFFHRKSLQNALANLFWELGLYFKIKSSLFEPIYELTLDKKILKLAYQNSKVINALDSFKEAIINQATFYSQDKKELDRYSKIYNLSREIHQQVNSSYQSYELLITTFFHSDILFRLQHLLYQYGIAFQKSLSLENLSSEISCNKTLKRGFISLYKSIKYLEDSDNKNSYIDILNILRLSTLSLESLSKSFGNSTIVSASASIRDVFSYLTTCRKKLDDLRKNITITSPVFRHSLRIPLAIASGFIVIKWVHPDREYWIILTTLFVCQPSYSATRRRLKQRILGTVLGLAIGLMLFNLFPSPPLTQAVFTVITGVLYLTNRTSSYGVSTAAITLMVLFCSNTTGNGSDIFLTRLIDTMIGCLIVALSVYLFLPDWHTRKFSRVMSNIFSSHSAYLRQILNDCLQNNSNYQVTGWKAQKVNATLSDMFHSMVVEPVSSHTTLDLYSVFLVSSSCMLSYLHGLEKCFTMCHLKDPKKDSIIIHGYRVLRNLDFSRQIVAKNNTSSGLFTKENKNLVSSLEEALLQEKDPMRRLVILQLALVSQELHQLYSIYSYSFLKEGHIDSL